jgi:hypothetical protein
MYTPKDYHSVNNSKGESYKKDIGRKRDLWKRRTGDREVGGRVAARGKIPCHCIQKTKLKTRKKGRKAHTKRQT